MNYGAIINRRIQEFHVKGMENIPKKNLRDENSPNLGNRMPINGKRHTDIQTVLEKKNYPQHN